MFPCTALVGQRRVLSQRSRACQLPGEYSKRKQEDKIKTLHLAECSQEEEKKTIMQHERRYYALSSFSVEKSECLQLTIQRSLSEVFLHEWIALPIDSISNKQREDDTSTIRGFVAQRRMKDRETIRGISRTMSCVVRTTVQ